MKALPERPVSIERPARTLCGTPILTLSIATCVAVPFILMEGIRMAEWASVTGGVIVLIAMILVWRGLFTLESNEACVIVRWGEYRGTVRESGFYWTNPLARKTPISLRARTLSVDRLKLLDKQGTPIEMAASIVWRVAETARASFDVYNVTDFVRDQCESAVRHLAPKAADSIDQSDPAFRLDPGELQESLRTELQERVMRAGVIIDEVRLTHRCENWSTSRYSASVDI
jgi:regulator of protease activity HflC (stomatin/prohibitin superfamily)